MKQFFSLVLFLLFISVHAQFGNLGRGTSNSFNRLSDTTATKEVKVKLSGNTKYTDYKIISFERDTTVIDTTLTIQKEYKFNFRRKDNFELLSFHNQGQTFNNLAYDFRDTSIFPDIGFRAKQFNYMSIDEIPFYQVPTPTTEIMAKTGLEQGQVLDALFTLNFNKRMNFSIAYRGLRSLGQYRQSLSSTGNFRSTFNYSTPKGQYEIRAQVATQDFSNQESGGLTDDSLEFFLSNDEDYLSRGRLDVNLEDAESLFEGNRFFLDHSFKLFSSKPKDSTSQRDFTNLKVGHQFLYEKKFFNFTQDEITTDFFGDAAKDTGEINETADYTITNNQAYLEFNSKYILGRFKVKANYSTVNYGYDSIYNGDIVTYNKRLKGNAFSLGASWNGNIGNFKVNADGNLAPGSGHLAGNYLHGEAIYKKDSVFTVKGNILLSSKAPNFNFQLFQSTYDTYHWENNFDNVNTRNLGVSFQSKWGNASLDFTNIEDYTYFGSDKLPQQFGEQITYLKVKANKEFKFFNVFALDNTLMYQNVSSGSNVFRVPEFVTRNTLYYMDHWFKGDPILVQIGATFNYFTKYKANAYDPLLGEFILQDDTEIGYPTIDVFFNARIRRTRLYFKLDNVSSNFLEPNYFSAPDYPYRDMSIRFGIVWNWFI